MRKRLMAMIASIAVLISFAACSSDNGDTKPVSDDASTETLAETETSAEAETDRADIKDDIGEYDFEGETFTITLSTKQMKEPYIADSETGDLVNDAVYARTLAVEERFNIELAHYDTGGDWNEVAEAVRKSVAANDNAYDLAAAHTFIGLTGLMTSGALYDWNKLPVVDMDQPWWNSTAIDKLSIDNVLLTASSDYIYQRPMVTYFNKDMINSYSLESPYQLVDDGKWTWGKLGEMAKVTSSDLNGDGKYDTNDQYGYSHMLGWQTVSVISSMGMSMTNFDEDGYPRFDNFTTDKMVSIFDIFYDIIYSDNRTLLPVWETSMGALGGYTPLFGSGQVLFLHSNTELLPMFREIEIDFGMLPLPKYDELQENYNVICDTQVLIVPSDITDPEMVGVISEALAAESYRKVVPAVYEVTFENKYLRDEESYHMFDIIREGIVYEFGWTYGEGNDMIYALPNLMQQKSKDIASYYAKRVTSLEKQLAKVIDGVRDTYN